MTRVITDTQEALEYLQAFPATGDILLDTETSGLDMFARENPARMVGLALGLFSDPSYDCYIALRHGEGENVADLEAVLQPLRHLVKTRTLVNHNVAFDLRILHCDGFELPPAVVDSMIAANLCFEEETSFALKSLGAKYLGDNADAPEKVLHAELKARGLKGKGDMWKLPASLVAPYAIRDIELVRQLMAMYTPMLARWRLTDLFKERNEYRLILTEMELRGLPLDREEIQRQRARINPRLAELRTEINTLAGKEVNPNSTAHMREWLGIKDTKSETLKLMVERDQDIRALRLLEYRSLSKAENAFFRPLLEKCGVDGRIRSNFNCARTKTLRLSSSDPNAQQLSRNQVGRAYSVRDCFVAPEGYFLVDADLSSIEPRVAAHFSQDAGMIQAFKDGLDVHRRAAQQIYRKKDISSDERTSAKALSLGTLYSLGAHKASKKLGLRHDKDAAGNWVFHHTLVWTIDDADELVQVPCSYVDAEFCTCSGKEYVSKFLESWPTLKPCINAITRQAEMFGYVRIPLTGAVRRFPDRRYAFRAFNSVVQMTAGEILRRAIMRMAKAFRSMPDAPQLLSCVHDSAVVAVKFGPYAWEQVKFIKECMETTSAIDVPTPSDVKIGMAFGNMGQVQI